MVKKRRMEGKQPLVILCDDEDDLAAVVISDGEDDRGFSSFGMAAWRIVIVALSCTWQAHSICPPLSASHLCCHIALAPISHLHALDTSTQCYALWYFLRRDFGTANG